MGAYLSKPVTDKISSDESNERLSYGASSMQGWRIYQEDAHNAILNYDKNRSLFAVYDGHGGSEVAVYTATVLPDFIKGVEAYNNEQFSQALSDAFLKFDAALIEPETMAIIKEIAGSKDKDDSDYEDGEEVDHLCKEASMPLDEVLGKYSEDLKFHFQSLYIGSKKKLGSSSDFEGCSLQIEELNESLEEEEKHNTSDSAEDVKCSSGSEKVIDDVESTKHIDCKVDIVESETDKTLSECNECDKSHGSCSDNLECISSNGSVFCNTDKTEKPLHEGSEDDCKLSSDPSADVLHPHIEDSSSSLYNGASKSDADISTSASHSEKGHSENTSKLPQVNGQINDEGGGTPQGTDGIQHAESHSDNVVCKNSTEDKVEKAAGNPHSDILKESEISVTECEKKVENDITDCAKKLESVVNKTNCDDTSKKTLDSANLDKIHTTERNAKAVKADENVEHEGTIENSVEHEGTIENSVEHEGTIENSVEHEGTIENSVEHEGTIGNSDNNFKSDNMNDAAVIAEKKGASENADGTKFINTRESDCDTSDCPEALEKLANNVEEVQETEAESKGVNGEVAFVVKSSTKGKGVSKGKKTVSTALVQAMRLAQRHEKKRKAAEKAEEIYKQIQSGGEEDSPSDDDDDEDDESFENEECLHTQEDISSSDESEMDDDEDEDDEEDEEEEEEEEEEDKENDMDDENNQYHECAMNMREEPGYDSGCTACVALINGNELYVANVGDSRCVVCRDGKALDMSVDHKPEDEPEASRITQAGGCITRDGRVNGGLNLSRALGDHSYKQNKNRPPEEQMISPLPDVRSLTLTPEDSFMVIACDGIWNSMTSQEVCDFVSERLDLSSSLSSIAEEIFDNCLSPDTLGDGTGCDNMTCIIVKFHKITLSPEKGKKRTCETKGETESSDPLEKKRRIEDV